MPYIFAALVAINVLALGYFSFLHEPAPTAALMEAKASLTQPIAFTNNSAKAPPLIGTKK